MLSAKIRDSLTRGLRSGDPECSSPRAGLSWQLGSHIPPLPSPGPPAVSMKHRPLGATAPHVPSPLGENKAGVAPFI